MPSMAGVVPGESRRNLLMDFGRGLLAPPVFTSTLSSLRYEFDYHTKGTSIDDPLVLRDKKEMLFIT